MGKGFHFIPEIGEEVLVGFEGGNAEKPFIMGTHYNEIQRRHDLFDKGSFCRRERISIYSGNDKFITGAEPGIILNYTIRCQMKISGENRR
ncbi:phage baseplate assembly protein V [Chryseobacterium sp. T9W2-O]|uniref:Phage baseplate assembly protein V n=1 Tax=Chryseobacterium salviniae TaxID=3101750 RepID=A0ABU6HMG0_9FLAO|nr:phage baseplate assembly protein V [Chryseobacterium sp. T9W2-O]MEC3874209.1 phage baseplate assembly protein V [Chryseobacterium sp. T9W2-O]